MATGPSPDQAEGWPVQLGEVWLPGTGHGGMIREVQTPSPQGCSPTSSFPFLINSGMGVGRGVRRLPGVLLPEGLPAVLFHVVFWTFTFKGGDEES